MLSITSVASSILPADGAMASCPWLLQGCKKKLGRGHVTGFSEFASLPEGVMVRPHL
jgi:hypothetical protein